jgi:predicted methyltransferase
MTAAPVHCSVSGLVVDLPDYLKDALVNLGDDPLKAVVPPELIRELITRGLIEAHGGGIRFTEAGRELFHKLRGTWPKKNR